jgi:hypothetical protein
MFVDILGTLYKVEYIDEEPETNDVGDATYGDYDASLLRIRVWIGDDEHRRQPLEVMKTLTHEMWHAIHNEVPLLLAPIKALEDEYVDSMANLWTLTVVTNGMLDVPKLPTEAIDDECDSNNASGCA